MCYDARQQKPTTQEAILKNLQKRKQISFSQVKTFSTCPLSYHLSYNLPKEEQPVKTSIHNAFGNAIHDGIEAQLTFQPFDFKDEFYRRMDEMNENEKEKVRQVKDVKKLYREMFNVGEELIEEAIDFLNKNYSSAELHGVEKKIKEPINDKYKFKGVVDLELKDIKENRYKVLDWKTCSWGWDARRRTDKMTLYQPTLYKHFLCQKEEINPKETDASLVLLKRTQPKGKRVEEIKVTTGEKRTKNALQIVENCAINIYERKKKYKIVGEHCKFCSFNNTKHCPGKKG